MAKFWTYFQSRLVLEHWGKDLKWIIQTTLNFTHLSMSSVLSFLYDFPLIDGDIWVCIMSSADVGVGSADGTVLIDVVVRVSIKEVISSS